MRMFDKSPGGGLSQFQKAFVSPDPVEYPDRPQILDDDLKSVFRHLDDKSISIYKLYREKVVHEDTLINWRTTWFVTLQAFIFTAFSLSQDRLGELQDFVNLSFCILGILISIASFVSITAAKSAINKTVGKWRFRYSDQDGRLLHRGVRDLIDPAGLLPAIKGAGSSDYIAFRGNVFSFLVPLIIGVFWVVLMVVFYLQAGMV